MLSEVSLACEYFRRLSYTYQYFSYSLIGRLESNKDAADIKLSQHLDYESNTVYTLIVRVQNKYQLAAETVIDIEVLDVNDNIPVFRDLKKGRVLENEPPGVPVMQVRAIDADGTSAHNQVRTSLLPLPLSRSIYIRILVVNNSLSQIYYIFALVR